MTAIDLARASAAHPAYRADIDGLRAVAVALVVAYHFFPNHLPAGFIGVDIFFVISGFLISSIIFDQIEQGRWSYLNFYTRRINRIFPALALVLLANLVLGWVALVPDEFHALGKHVAASAAFVSNFALWNEAGYFDNVADTKPLLHLWSLAIEEQFYIVWPLLLTVLIRGRNIFLKLALVMVAVSFAYSAYAAIVDPTAAYYSPVSRFWQLATGGLLAYAQRNRVDRFVLGPDLRALIGVALLVVSIAIIDKNRAFPGAWALLPTLGTAALISAGAGAWFNRMLLASGPMVWIGLISYPLYMWHWTVLVWAKMLAMSNNIPATWRLGLIALTVVLAWLTFVLCEKPVRRRNRGGTALVLSALIAAMGLVGVLYWTGMVNNRLNGQDLDKVVAAIKDWDYPPQSFKPHTRFSDYNFYIKTGRGPGTVLFVGDSNVEQYAARVERVIDLAPQGQSAIFATKGGCPFTIPLLAERTRDCRTKLATIDGLIQSGDVSTVVFVQAWKNLTSLVDDPAVAASFESRLASIPKDKRVFIVLNMPTGLEFSPTSLLSGSRLGRLEYRSDAVLYVDEAAVREPFHQLNETLRSIAQRYGATVLDPFDTLCANGRCPLVDRHGAPTYKDTAHITASFSREAATFIDVTLGKVKAGPTESYPPVPSSR